MPFVTLAAMAAAQVFVPRQGPGPGHIPPPAPTAQRSLVSWTPGDVRCDQGVATGQALRRPLAHMYWGPPSSPSSAPGPELRPGVLRFDIDDTGRPLSIRRDGVSYAPDLAPALAASRFAAGGKRTGCTITYTPRVTPLDQAPVADLIAYTLSPESGPLPQEGWARIRREGNCDTRPVPQPLLRALPDFRKLPATPGVKDWSMVDYEIDAEGQPRQASVTHSTGNKALDQAAITAVEQSRFTPGARTGCRYPYWMAPATIAAPPAPAPGDLAPAGANCTRPYPYATAPRLSYPPAYNRRRVEGWAIVSFDVAPWGDIGNVKVLAAQPAEDFGTHAVQVMRTARFQPSSTGLSGCVERLSFVTGPNGTPEPTAPPPPPPEH
ncbi:MAG: energy transducer TonB [Sphingomonas sp.]